MFCHKCWTPYPLPAATLSLYPDLGPAPETHWLPSLDQTHQNILRTLFWSSASARNFPPFEVMPLADRLEHKPTVLLSLGPFIRFCSRLRCVLPEVGEPRVVLQSFSKSFCSLITDAVPPHPARPHEDYSTYESIQTPRPSLLTCSLVLFFLSPVH